MSGKWHVGSEDKAQWPNQRDFDKFYGILKGASNYFDTKPLPFEGYI